MSHQYEFCYEILLCMSINNGNEEWKIEARCRNIEANVCWTSPSSQCREVVNEQLVMMSL